MGTGLLLFFVIRHHLWEYTSKIVVTFLFLASQPLPRQRIQALPQLLYQQVKGFCWGSLLQSCQNEYKVLCRLKVEGASSFPFFWWNVLLFWLWEFQLGRKATLEPSSLKKVADDANSCKHTGWLMRLSQPERLVISVTAVSPAKILLSLHLLLPHPLLLLQIEVWCDLRSVDFADPRIMTCKLGEPSPSSS